MKKIVLTMVAAMAFTLSFAETESFGSEKNYDMSCDIDRLAVVLDLDESQLDAVEAIHENFSNEMQSLASMRGPWLRHRIHQALGKDAFQMRQVLNDKQLNTYMQLMVTTIRNRQL